MKLKLGLFLIPAILFATCFMVCAQQVQPVPEGMKPYIPTRLEWLALDLNANYRQDMNELEGYMLNFVALDTENTILIYVSYNKQTRRELMNRGIDNARKLVENEARSRGWDSWLKVKEEVKLLD
ncbi:MAG: hypothetical protein WCF59_07225 [Desulfobaccales bacterium]